MPTTELKCILAAMQTCLDITKCNSDLRPIVRKHVSEYEECLDVSISQHLQLIAGFMDAYVCLSKCETLPYFDVGEEPLSYVDAIRLLDSFVGAAKEAVSKAFDDSTFLLAAPCIGARAQTFSSVILKKS
jgi:hypothetical protein